MDDAEVMGGGHAERDLVGDAEHLGHGRRPGVATLSQGLALDVLHDQVVVVALVEHVVDPHDRRVVEPGGDPRLAAEPLAALRSLGVVVQALDRDQAIEAVVVRQHDLAHAARAQSPDDAIRSDPPGVRHRGADYARPSSWIRRRSAGLDTRRRSTMASRSPPRSRWQSRISSTPRWPAVRTRSLLSISLYSDVREMPSAVAVLLMSQRWVHSALTSSLSVMSAGRRCLRGSTARAD